MPTPLSNPRLFPGFVAQYTVSYDDSEGRGVAAEFPGMVLPVALSQAVPKRQLDFAAGRYCAREAIRRCSPADADAVIASGPSREPLWPQGIVGAITHTRGYASVAVARMQDARGIGLDAERWMENDVAARVLDSIAERAEVATVAGACGWSAARALTLIFSAKETLFKCLFPAVQRYFDFLDAALVSADVGRRELVLELRVTLAPSLHAGARFGGTFDYDDQLVCTGMVDVPPSG
jgi:enterobactin synthetase component D